MKKQEFHQGWYFKRLNDPGKGRPITLPHDAMLEEERTADAASGVNGAWFVGADYLYEKEFVPAPELDGKRLVLEFEGVYRKAEVWVNDTRAAFHPYGFTGFFVELTERLRAGQANVLRVIARNADQPNCRWYSGAGIYRPVNLWVGEQAHICLNGIRITTRCIDVPQIEVQVKTNAAGTLHVQIMDGTRQLYAAKTQTDGVATLPITLPEAMLWSPEHPKCYTCRVRFGADEATERFGIRSIAWGKDGFLLNGSRVILRGACIHHDNGLLGAACYPDAVERKVALLLQNGYNAIRSAHNPCSKALLEACDRLGMLVLDEYIDHWYIHKNQYDYVEFFDAWWRRDLCDMVDKDYNHPCVIAYSTGNEVSETAQPRGIRLTREMTQHLHRLDDTRPVTCGINILFNLLSSIGFGVYSDKKAEKEAARAEKNRKNARPAKQGIPVGSRFFNEMAGLFGAEFMKTAAMLRGCDKKTRDAFAAMDIAGYNYGIYRYRRDLRRYPDRLILGTETFCADAYRFWQLAQTQPRILGDFVWAGMDYLGEVGVGSHEYRDYAPSFSHGVGWISAGSGRLDLTGKPLCEAAYTRVAFGLENGPCIGVRPVNHTGHRHSPSAWKLSNAVSGWSWDGCEGARACVEVYARAHRVELLVNGVRVGKKRLKDGCIARFRCTYQPGCIEAVSYDAAGRELGRSSLHSAQGKTILCAESERISVRPGGLSFIRLRYAGENGVTRPLERGILKVQVVGGKLLALGSACPYYEGSYLHDTTDTYFGEALAVVRAEEAGSITLRVTDGIRSASVQLPIEKEAAPC